jgi:non-heme chloroperoxidase
VFTTTSLAEINQTIQMDQSALVEEFVDLMLHEPDDETRAWMTGEILQVPPVIASTILVDQTLRDYREYLPKIATPALVMFGEDPKLTSPDAGRYIADRIPGARFQGFANSSHCPFYEEAEAFNDAVGAFAAGVKR